MYQIQGLERRGAIEKLARSNYDVLVVEPTNTGTGSERFDVTAMVKRLKSARPGRLVLAYIDIGEAEDYRTYWQSSWRRPTRGKKGSPSFLVAQDPDGWEGNYPVAYWDRRWHKLMIEARDSALKNALAGGFDGVYLDWVEGYDDDSITRRARRVRRSPAREMVRLISRLRSVAREQDPDFLVVAQNAPYLIDTPGYLSQIDAAAFESTWYGGKGDAGWNSKGAGDVKRQARGGLYTTASLLATYGRYSQAGKNVSPHILYLT